MSAERMRRVDEAVREVLSEAIKELKDPRVGFVTVTEVRTSTDLRHARVWVSVLEGPGPTLDGLESARGFLQGRVGAELRMKRTPALRFLHDDTAERAARLEQRLGSEPA
jgi:ribosome-binding factor A